MWGVAIGPGVAEEDIEGSRHAGTTQTVHNVIVRCVSFVGSSDVLSGGCALNLGHAHITPHKR